VGGKELPRRHRRKTTKEEVVRDHSNRLGIRTSTFFGPTRIIMVSNSLKQMFVQQKMYQI